VLAKIQALLPDNRRGRFIEPFLGSGVVYLNTPGFSSYVIADANRDLIDLYGFIRADASAVAALVTELFGELSDNTPGRYYRMRDEFNACAVGTLRRAALFIFLNRFGFNGMCRYNQAGGFNVPHGQAKTILNPTDAIIRMGRILNERPAQLLCSDFRLLLAIAGEGDTVYLDSPYVALSSTANFSSYIAGGFSDADQYDLAQLARKASVRGALVIVSNHDTAQTRDLYAGATIIELQVTRSVGADASSRKKVGELLAVFGPNLNAGVHGLQLAVA